MTINDENPVYGPARAAATFYAGRRYTWHDAERYPNGAYVGIRNKHMRRVIRKLANRGRVGKAIIEARLQRLDDENYASNAHEARRYHEKLKAERRARRIAKRESEIRALAAKVYQAGGRPAQEG